MSDLPKQGTKKYAMADALSRPNAMNGLYRKLGFPLEWEDLNAKDALLITHLVNLADSLIEEAKANSQNLDDSIVQAKIQATFSGGTAGATGATVQHKFLHFLGIRK